MLYFEKEGVKLLKGDCLNLLPEIEKGSVTTIFADPPYNLSNGGISCKGGKVVSVNKGDWDKSKGFEEVFVDDNGTTYKDNTKGVFNLIRYIGKKV